MVVYLVAIGIRRKTPNIKEQAKVIIFFQTITI